jgi:subtilase family serine protease
VSGLGASQQTLRGHVPLIVKKLSPLGPLPSSTPLKLQIGLPLRNQSALNDLLQQLYDPSSPAFGRFLTPQEFTRRFGPGEEDYQSVIHFASAHGLRVTGLHPNRILLEVEGPAADIEKALHVHFRVYSHPTERRTFFAADADPSLDLDVPVLDIAGLDNYELPRPMSLRQTDRGPQATPLVGSATDGAYLGADFRAAYAPGVTLTGAGQTVALLEFDGYYTNDIALYRSDAGLPSVPLQKVLLDGFSGNAGPYNEEVALDIEMVISMAPGLAKVIVYEGTLNSRNTLLNRMATDNLAKQLSSSWQFAVNATTEQIFQQFVAQGQSLFQASGDYGAYYASIGPPSDDPNLISVGGTTLTTGAPGAAWLSETTWNWYGTTNAWAASGGGVSSSHVIPTWQKGISMTANQGSTLLRNVPDVALTADNIWVRCNNGGTDRVGGTSASAPLWAAFMALIHQQAAQRGKSIGFLNPPLYSLAKGPKYSTLFHDITTGNNALPGGAFAYGAVPGYDLCTGWGTPAGQALINALTGVTNVAPVFFTNWFVGFLAIAGEAYAGSIFDKAMDPDPGDQLTFSKVSGASWLVVSTNGALSGTPSTANAGTNTFVVKATDSGGLSSSATMVITVDGPPIFLAKPFTESAVTAGMAYSANISTNASDPNSADTLTFSKISGPAWLAVGGNGALSGTPLSADVGTNTFLLRVTDPIGLADSATMSMVVLAAPRIALRVSMQGNQLALDWTGGISPYQVQWASDLGHPNWQSIGSLVLSQTLVLPATNAKTFFRIQGR